MKNEKVIEVDCRKCVNLGNDGCIPYGKDANVAVKKCAGEGFSCYVSIDEHKKKKVRRKNESKI